MLLTNKTVFGKNLLKLANSFGELLSAVFPKQYLFEKVTQKNK